MADEPNVMEREIAKRKNLKFSGEAVKPDEPKSGLQKYRERALKYAQASAGYARAGAGRFGRFAGNEVKARHTQYERERWQELQRQRKRRGRFRRFAENIGHVNNEFDGEPGYDVIAREWERTDRRPRDWFEMSNLLGDWDGRDRDNGNDFGMNFDLLGSWGSGKKRGKQLLI